MTVSFSPATYTPGTPVAVTVRVTDPTNRRYGFQMSARLESNLAKDQAGKFSAATGLIVLCDDGNLGIIRVSNCPATAPLEFIEHSTPSSAGTWTFNWTPPSTSAGPVHFYVAGNAVNGNGKDDGGDHVYTASAVLQPAGDCSDPTPAITSAISAGAYGARTDFAAGSWVEIYGTDLSAATGTWDDIFTGSTAPTSVQGVSVKFGDKPAAVWYVGPGQVNAQAPDNPGAGSFPITVTKTVGSCTKTSSPFSMQQVAAAPGLLAPSQAPFLSSGKQWLAVPVAGGAFVGIPTAPVKPGDAIVLYGVGFGATNPAVAAGAKAPAAEPLARLSNVVVTIGGVQLTAAQVLYAGMAPNFVGLYQFNLVVPNVPDGDQAFTMQVNGVPLKQTLFLTVKK